jgi:DNA-binding MarR family transcriptional regulator
MRADHWTRAMSIPEEPVFTDLQGQYLAFIHAYTRLNRRPPAEADMQRFFGVTPPSVHRMVIELDRLGLIQRTPGVARSVELLVPTQLVPRLR